MQETKKNLYFISFLQFIGPILVILGHSVNGLPHNDILQGIRDFIYVFHMPLFFFMSSYLFAYKYRREDINLDYKQFLKNKFWRLLFPYIVLNVICILPKMIVDPYISDNIDNSLAGFVYLWINPRANILGHTWFLFALFEIYLLAPLWNYIIKKNKKYIWILIFGITIIFRLLTQVVNTDILAINDLLKNLLFFVLGLYLGNISVENLEAKATKKNFIFYLVIFVCAFALWLFTRNIYTITLLCTVILILLLKLPIVFNIKNEIINKVAKYSYTIYIFHWPVMLFIRILLYQILNINYLIVSLFMGLCGYLVPLAIIKLYNLFKRKFNKEYKIIHYLLGI